MANKGNEGKNLSSLPEGLSTLEETLTIQERARHAGFDWEKREDVWDKVREELAELIVEVKKLDADKMEDEFGDFLFSIINAEQLYGIDPEKALKRCNNKFRSRFGHIEARAFENGRTLNEMTPSEMMFYWKEAKAIEKGLGNIEQ